MKIIEMLESNDPEVFRLAIQSLPEDFYTWLNDPKTLIRAPFSDDLIKAQLYSVIFQNVLECDRIEIETNTMLISVYMYFKGRYSMSYKASYISIIQQYEDFRTCG